MGVIFATFKVERLYHTIKWLGLEPIRIDAGYRFLYNICAMILYLLFCAKDIMKSNINIGLFHMERCMPSVVFVDDEPSVLEGLRLFLQWDELGFDIAGEASDGLEALSIIEKVRPELVISDIRMPALDGLALIEKASEISPCTKFIVLSGHQDFFYAQKALHLGALGYLTKPLDADALLQAVIKAKVSADDEKNQQKENLAFIRYTANQVYHEILNGAETQKLQDKARLLFSLPGIDSKIQLLWFSVSQAGRGLANMEPDDRVFALLMGVIGLKDENCVFYHGFGHYIMILHENHGLPAFGHCSMLEAALAGSVNHAANVDEGFSYIVERVFISGVQAGGIVNAFRACAAQLETLQAYAMLHAKKRILIFEAIQNWRPNRDMLPDAPFKAVLEAIKGTREEDVRLAIADFFHILRQSKTSWRIYTLSLYRLADLISKTAYAYGIEASAVIHPFIASIENISRAEEFALEMCLYLFQKQNQYNDKPIALLENEIMDYIKENFACNLSIQKIADVFSLSPAIISKIIKKQARLKFNGYINSLRIEQAKKLIASSNMKITAISEASGYSDYAYFTGKFKELTGVTPSDYKKQFYSDRLFL